VNHFSDKVSFIWSVADLLRGPYRPNQYGRVILPLTVLRRLDCVLEPTKDKVLKKAESLAGGKVGNVDPILNRAAGVPFHNTSKLTFARLKDDPGKIARNLASYIKSFSANVRGIFERFAFEEHIAKLDEHNRLFLVVSKFCDIDLHPDAVPNIEMGYIFEELIRRFSEAANETAGDHFTPREVIRLMVNVLFQPDSEILTRKGIVKTMLDPACGTGGMLAVSDEYLRELNPDARLEAFGQDYNPESYAVCGSDMLIKGHNIDHIVFADSFTSDGFAGQRFDDMLANPPFGVEWKPEQDAIRREHEQQGFSGRFGAGPPRINDGSLLFLQHMISKTKPLGGLAFSGTVEDPDVKDPPYTEPGMNIDIRTGKPIGEKQLPERFAEADYQVLIVADKYQTGFDQPLLHTMYVDKRLAGVQAVQPLSPLNRTGAGKEDTFVLDFYNEATEIEEAFKPYCERTTVGRQAEPAQLNDLFDKIMDRQIIWREESRSCAKRFTMTGTSHRGARTIIPACTCTPIPRSAVSRRSRTRKCARSSGDR